MKVKDLFYNKYLGCLVLVLTVIAVYWPVLLNQFLLQWDDQIIVMNSYTLSSFTWINIWEILTSFHAGQYAPMNQLFYTLLYFLSGNEYNPMVFHSGCLMVHIINVLLVYNFIKRLLLQSKSFEMASASRIGFLTALLIGVHPFLVEAVAWISASKIILYVMLFMIGLLFYLKYVETKRFKYWFLTLLFFILSFGAKEQAVVMPLILLIIDFVLKRGLKDTKVWMEKLPFFLLALFFSVVTLFSQREVTFMDTESYPIYQRFVFACYSLTEYVTKFVLPIRLSYLYPFPNQPGEPLLIRFWIYPVAIILLIIGLWGYFKRFRWTLFGVAWFVIGLLPALHIISLHRFTIVADRYSYLSGIGLFFIMAYLLNVFIVNKSKYKNVYIISGCLYVFLLCGYSNSRTKTWYDTKTLKKELRDLVKQRDDYQKLKGYV